MQSRGLYRRAAGPLPQPSGLWHRPSGRGSRPAGRGARRLGRDSRPAGRGARWAVWSLYQLVGGCSVQSRVAVMHTAGQTPDVV
jgi:hypothetical protein